MCPTGRCAKLSSRLRIHSPCWFRVLLHLDDRIVVGALESSLVQQGSLEYLIWEHSPWSILNPNVI